MIIIGITLLFLVGYMLVNLVDNDLPFFEKIFTGFLASSGISTFLWFLVNSFGYIFDLKMCVVVILALLSVLMLANFIFKKINISFGFTKKIKISKIQIIVILCITVAVASSLLANLYWPIRDWDALTLYDFRGKFFASQNSIFKVFQIHRYYLGYPLYTSLFHSFIYMLNSNGNPLFIYTIIYLSFITVWYSVLKRITNSKIALFFTLLISFVYEIFDHSLLSYTNLPYSTFLILGYLYFLNYVKSNKINLLVLSSLLIGLSGWVRSSDPFWIPPVLLMIYESIKNRKFKDLALFISIILLIRMPWSFYVSEVSKNYTVTSSNNMSLLLSTSITTYIDRLFLVIPYIWVNVIKPQFTVYMMFILTLLMYIPKRSKVLKTIGLLVILNLCIIIGGVYFYSIVYQKWQVIGNSVTRMSIFMTPLILVNIAITLFNKYPKVFNNEK